MKKAIQNLKFRKVKSQFILILLLAINLQLFSGIVEKSYYFNAPLIYEKENYHYLEMDECYYLEEPTKPKLPVKEVKLLLPPGEKAIKVWVNGQNLTPIDGGYLVYPVQFEQIVSDYKYRFTEPDMNFYNSTEKYPEGIHSTFHTQYYRGHSIVVVQIYPVVYEPKARKLSYYQVLNVKVESSSTVESENSYNNLYRGDETTRQKVQDLAQNNSVISKYPLENEPKAYYDTDYLIVTTNAFESDFDEFVKFKTLQGYYTEVVTVEDIYASYYGYDNPDKIRLCIRDYYQNHGTDYVLLGGDTENVPHRGLFGHFWLNADPDPIHVADDLPADIYYAGLDRVGPGSGPDWNVDDDSMWGEVDVNDPTYGDITEADFTMEIFIGRICADSHTEFANALNKQIMYQKDPVIIDNKKSIMVGQKMWVGYCGDEAMEQVRLGGTYNSYTTNGFEDGGFVSQLQYACQYSPDTAWPVEHLIYKMNAGASIMSHLGHGNVKSWMNFNTANGTVDLLTSDGYNHNFHMIYTQTCLGGSFDNRYPDGNYTTDCLSEVFTTHENGFFAIVSNSRYGLSGVGQRNNRYFFDAIFKTSNPIKKLGEMLAYSKDQSGYNWDSKRWQNYELNLFGDPSLELWTTNNPSTISSAVITSSVIIGMSQVTVQVSPVVAGLRVSVMTDNNDALFGTALTNSYGIATIDLNHSMSQEATVYGMVTGEDFLPFEFAGGLFIPGAWTGAVSTNWHDIGNWAFSLVPDATSDVVIPDGCPNYPIVHAPIAECNNLEIDGSASLILSNTQLSVNGNLIIHGELSMTSISSDLVINGDVSWESGSTASITNNAAHMEVLGHWNFKSGSNVHLDNGDVKLSGVNKGIKCYSANSYFHNLIIDTQVNRYIYYSSSSTEDLIITGDLLIDSYSLMKHYSPNKMILEGVFSCYGEYHFSEGTFIFNGPGMLFNSTFHSYFNNLEINASGTIELTEYLNIRGDLLFNNGSINTSGFAIYLKGNWENNVGLAAFTGSPVYLVLEGTEDQYILTDQDFTTLELKKTGGSLIFNDLDVEVTCMDYEWTSGDIKMHAGEFTAYGLTNSGIFGAYFIDGGTINLMNYDGYVDLNCDLTMEGGFLNVYGGTDDSFWPFANNAFLTMSSGIIDFKDVGIHFYDSPSWSFNENITGGMIRTTGNFTGSSNGLTPSGGTIELYGSDDANLGHGTYSTFREIIINKSALKNVWPFAIAKPSMKKTTQLPQERIKEKVNFNKNGSKSNQVTVISELDINNHLKLNTGELVFNGNVVDVAGMFTVSGIVTMTDPNDNLDVHDSFKWNPGSVGNITSGLITFEHAWYFEDGCDVQISAGNTAVAYGSGNQNINNDDDNSHFGNLYINKADVTDIVSSAGSEPVKVEGNLELQSYSHIKLQNDDFIVSGNVTTFSNSILEVDNGSLFTIENNMILNGTAHVKGNAEIDVQNDLSLNSYGHIIIDEGIFRISKPTGGELQYFDGICEINGGFLEITYNGLRINSGGLITMSGGEIGLGYTFNASNPNTFQPTGGAVKMKGSGFSSILIDGTNYFHDLIINKPSTQNMNITQPILINNDFNISTGWFQALGNQIIVMGDISIGTAGKLDPDNGDVYIGGNWENKHGGLGFSQGIGKVSFFGNDQSHVLNDETFYDLEVNKVGSYTYLYIDSAITCNVIHNVELIGASLRTREYATLNVGGDLIINENTNLFGSTVADSWFNITGDLHNHNTSGYPWAYGYYTGKSTMTFEGDGDNFIYCDYGLQTLNNLTVDKTGGWFMPVVDLVIEGDVNINQGSWNMDMPNLDFTVFGDFTVEATGTFDDNTSNIIFAGSEDQDFENYNGGVTTINNLTIDMGTGNGDNLPILLLYGNLNCTGNIVVDTGDFFINSNTVECLGNFTVSESGRVSAPYSSTIAMGDGSVMQIDGGELEMYGYDTFYPKITAITGNYEFNVMNGGLLSTSHSIFENMNIEGVNIYNNGLVYGTNALSSCIFRNGESGGTLLQINNDQDLIINDVEFPTNTWGGSHNVTKVLDQGSISFTNVVGDFSGPANEDDPHNIIDWDGFVPGIWTGAVSHSWNTAGNWQNDLKPTVSDDAYIPAGTPNEPWVATTDQECNNLTIETGASLRIYDEILTVHGDMIIFGTLRMDHTSGVLNVGDWPGEIISWESGSTDLITNGTINVFGDWYFKNGTDAQLGTSNTVNFYGTNRSYIYCDDDNATFGVLEVNKTGVPKDFVHVPSGNTVRVAEDFNVYDGTFELNPGSSLFVANELVIFSGATLSSLGTAFDEILISGYPSYGIFEIGNGATISAEHTLFEYFEGGGVVIADGATIDPAHPFDHCIFQEGTVGGSLLTINNNQVLTIDKVIFPADGWNNNNRVAKTLDQGQITFTSVMGGYVGDNYENDPNNLIHWPGVIAGIWNGQDNNDWDNEANWDHYLKPSATDDVLIPTACIRDPIVYLADQECNNLTIESGTTLEIVDKVLTVDDDIIIHGELIMNNSSGILNAGSFFGDIISWEPGSSSDVTAGTINVYGDWNFTNGTDAQFGGANAVVFYGANNSIIYCDDADARFCSMTINKTASPKDNVTIPDNHIVRIAEDFYISDGKFNVGEGSIFEVGNEMIVDNGGTLSSIGSAGNQAIVTGIPSYCLLEIASGGTISAEYTEFKFMDYYGVVVNPGALVDELHPFNYCTFHESPVGGSLLTINNSQNLVIDGAIFPENTWGGGNNVSKTSDQGNISFTNVEGAFVGEDYENDNYNRIDWPGVVAGIWTGVVSPIWNDPGNWAYHLKPDAGDDVYIPAGTPNDPWVSEADQECNSIIIESGASLRIYDEELTVYGDLIINGHLRMDHMAGVLNAGSKFGDIISWENGSSETVSSGTINVFGDWYFQNEANVQFGAGNTVNFYGGNNSNVYCYESSAEFGNVTIHKTANPKDIVNISSFNTVKIAEDLYIRDGELKLNEGTKLYVGNEFYVDNGGSVTAIGLPSREAMISGYPNHCALEIADGGSIGAEYAVFEFLEYYGVNINPGATVNTMHPFNNCKFRESITYGSLLTVSNDQDLTIDGAHFESNTWSGDYNVRKTVDEGHLTFINTTGDFAGDLHEYDTYNRIDWYRPWYDINLRVFLEGPFNTTNMNTSLSSTIPMSQPFNTTPWNYNGTETVLEIPYKVVDWVLVELRDASGVASATSGTLISRRAGFVKNNGYILDLEGLQSLQFNEFIHDELYVVVYHRNHIGVISANSLIESGGSFSYDFTLSEGEAYGGLDGHKEIAPGIWGLIGGDANGDGEVGPADKGEWNTNVGKRGYIGSDFNLDTQINNKDKNDIWHFNLGKESQIPD